MAVETRELPCVRTTLNVSAATTIATVSPATAGVPGPVTPVHCVRVIINTAGGTATTINDCATTGAASAANMIISIPSTVVAGTVVTVNMPCFVGLTIVPGTSAVLAVGWNPS